MLDVIRDRIRDAARERKPLRIRGGGSKDFYGATLDGELLDVSGHAGIVSYEPTELVVTARCGTKLADLERTLAEQDQLLGFEPPHFAGGATLGGAVAAGLSGPRRAHAGSARDFVLGAQVVDGNGELMSFGGRVMKNVAGYDVSRLLCGSLGTLGIITEVTLKVLPSPIAELSLRFEIPQDDAIARLNAWAGRPLPISASAWADGQLTVRLSGAAAGIAAARGQLGGESLTHVEAGEFWTALRDQAHPFFGASPLWRLSVPSSTPALDLPGAQLLEWTGGLRWLAGDADPARVRAVAERAGGSATLFRADPALKRRAGAFPPLAPALAVLHRRVKQAFDPNGVLNPGRLYAGL
jgi:glycolate oxidase FAD binding subunit